MKLVSTYPMTPTYLPAPRKLRSEELSQKLARGNGNAPPKALCALP